VRKSQLPVGSIVTINGRLAQKIEAADEGFAWVYVEVVQTSQAVDYDDVYKATWDFVK
jgi:hypothetical protein